MSVSDSNTSILDKIFGPEGVKGLEHLAKTFELKDVIENSGSTRPAYSVFVPDTASLSPDLIQSLPENDKVAVACILNALSTRSDEDLVSGAAQNHPRATLSWDALQNELMQATYLKSDTDPSAPQTLAKSSRRVRWLKFSNSHPKLDSKVVSKLLLSISREKDDTSSSLVDPLFQLLSLDPVAESHCGKESRNPSRGQMNSTPFLPLSELVERLTNAVLVEVRILRFPDPNSRIRRFTISRIRLVGWMTQDKLAFGRESITGITAEQVSRHFSAHSPIIDQLQPAVRRDALQQVDALFPFGPDQDTHEGNTSRGRKEGGSRSGRPTDALGSHVLDSNPNGMGCPAVKVTTRSSIDDDSNDQTMDSTAVPTTGPPPAESKHLQNSSSTFVGYFKNKMIRYK